MNEQENIENKFKSNSKNIFFILVAIIISAVILAVLIQLLLVNSKVNQGKYRVSDAIIISDTKFIDKSKETGTWSYDVYQSNLLSLLVSTGSDISRAYISDISATGSNIEVSQQDFDGAVYANTGSDLELASDISEDGNVLYEINIINKGILNNFEISSDVEEIKHDASIFKLAGISNSDLQFNISFNLNIQEKDGRLSVMKVQLKLPYKDIIESGTSVTRMDIGDLVFKLK